jgi:hypothetical protein
LMQAFLNQRLSIRNVCLGSSTVVGECPFGAKRRHSLWRRRLALTNQWI